MRSRADKDYPQAARRCCPAGFNSPSGFFPNLLDCKATFVEPPRMGGDLPPVQILLPDSTTVRSDSDDLDRVLSAYFKRNITLGRAAPNDFTIDQYHPDVEGADPGGNRDTVVARPKSV